jgi:hypothetical protein
MAIPSYATGRTVVNATRRVLLLFYENVTP